MPREDIVRRGDCPKVSAVVLDGMVARYHTLQEGRRQHLCLHIAGDMLTHNRCFWNQMDHAVCAMHDVVVALVPHKSLLALFDERPTVGFAFWRETLIDAACFREAITNNGARPMGARLAHFFCKQFYRARKSGLTKANACRLPLTQTELSETVGASLPSITRGLQTLRKSKAVALRSGELHVLIWERLVELGEFNPSYLHLKNPISIPPHDLD